MPSGCYLGYTSQIPILHFSLSIDRLPWETTQTLLREAFGSVANKEINAHNTGEEPHERHAQTVCGCVTYLLSTTFSLSLASFFLCWEQLQVFWSLHFSRRRQKCNNARKFYGRSQRNGGEDVAILHRL